jgi:hypothetical protein
MFLSKTARETHARNAQQWESPPTLFGQSVPNGTEALNVCPTTYKASVSQPYARLKATWAR